MTLLLAGILFFIAVGLFAIDRWCEHSDVNLTKAAMALIFVALCLIAYHYWQTPAPDTSYLW